MKNSKINLLIICLALFSVLGCNNFDLLSKKSDSESRIEELEEKSSRTKDEARPPKNLNAKLHNNFPIPADAVIIHDKKPDRGVFRIQRVIKLESTEAVYDVAHFFRKEMEKNGWTGDEKNDRKKEDPCSILSFLDFSNETEQADIKIRSISDEGSEIEISIREKLENSVPLPECARGSNRISNESGMTVSTVCSEKLSVVGKFYEVEFPKKGWKLSGQTGDYDSDETIIFTFSKETRKAVITLVEDGKNSTSINIRISK